MIKLNPNKILYQLYGSEVFMNIVSDDNSMIDPRLTTHAVYVKESRAH